MSSEDSARALLDAVAGYTDDEEGNGYTPSQDRPPRLATVDAAFTGIGNPKVTFDGELTMSTKTYPMMETVAAGDRVVLLPLGRGYIIIGKMGAPAPAAGRNRLINGSFRTNQRAYVSATSIASGVYCFDRWKATTAATTVTFTAAPQGQTVTLNADKSIAQIIERANMPAGSYTLSWSGTARGRVYNVGAAAPAYGASGSTWAVDGLADVTVEFTTPAGVTGTLGLVQLEAGAIATAFERVSVDAELLACQRFYVRWLAQQSEHPIATGFQVTTTYGRIVVALPCPMRTAPTVTWSGLEVSNNSSFRTVVTSWQSTPRLAASTLFLSPVHAAAGAGLGPLVLELTTAGTSYMEASAEL